MYEIICVVNGDSAESSLATPMAYKPFRTRFEAEDKKKYLERFARKATLVTPVASVAFTVRRYVPEEGDFNEDL